MFLTIEFDGFGHINVEFKYEKYELEETVFKFNFETDQTYLAKTISQLEKLLKGIENETNKN